MNVTWSAGKVLESWKDIVEALSEIRRKGLTGKLIFPARSLKILFSEGAPIGYIGNLNEMGEASEMHFIELSSEEILIEMGNRMYTRVDSYEKLIAHIRKVKARHALVLKGTPYYVVHLYDPTSVEVKNTWTAKLSEVIDPVERLREILEGEPNASIHVVSISDKWTLDVLKCGNVILGSALMMPEYVEPLTGANAFHVPLKSGGTWMWVQAPPTSCPEIKVEPLPELIERTKRVDTGVIEV